MNRIQRLQTSPFFTWINPLSEREEKEKQLNADFFQFTCVRLMGEGQRKFRQGKEIG